MTHAGGTLPVLVLRPRISDASVLPSSYPPISPLSVPMLPLLCVPLIAPLFALWALALSTCSHPLTSPCGVSVFSCARFYQGLPDRSRRALTWPAHSSATDCHMSLQIPANSPYILLRLMRPKRIGAFAQWERTGSENQLWETQGQGRPRGGGRGDGEGRQREHIAGQLYRAHGCKILTL